MFRTGTAATRDGTLTWLDRSGAATAAFEPAAAYEIPRLSPDGRQIAVAKNDGKVRNIWLLDLARRVSTRFTTGSAIDDEPEWSPDGSRIAFRSNRAGNFDLYQKAASGIGQEELLLRSDRPLTPEGWSPDGRFLVYRDVTLETKNDLWLLPMDGDRKPEPIAHTRFDETSARVSADGRWIAYASNESGRSEVYVQDFPNPASRVQISTDGGSRPHWRVDGRELLFQSAGTIMAVDIGIVDGRLKPGSPRAVVGVDGIRGSWDMSGDAKRFLVNVPVDRTPQATTPLTIVTSWK